MKKLLQLFGILVCLPVLALAQAVAPVCTPAAGTYATTVSVTCSTTTSGADIFYTLDGSTPTPESTKYTGPLTVSSSVTVKAIAAAAGVRRNNIQTEDPNAAGTYWKAPDWTDTGGAGTPSSVVHQLVTSPSLSGHSIEMSFTNPGPHQVNVLFSAGGAAGKCDTCTYHLYDYYLQDAASNCSAGATSEADRLNFISSLGLRDMDGAQWRRGTSGCASGHECLDIGGNSNVHWTYTGVSTTLFSCGAWHHFQRGEHTVPAEFTSKPCTDFNGVHWACVHEDYWTVDGNVFNNGGAGWTYPINALPGGWSSVDFIQHQGDISPSGGTWTEYLDNANYVSYFPASAITSNGYTITGGSGTPTAATPSIAPAGGFVSGTLSVTMADSTPAAVIHYATSGATPTCSSTTYSTAISVTSTTTVQAIACASGYLNSSVASAVYSYSGSGGLTATPTFSPTGGSYTVTQYVSISDTTSGAVIYYTTDGTTPTTASNVYSVPLAVTATATVKAMAVAPGLTNSSIASATYSIIATLTAGTPTFSPGTGNYAGTQTVTITCPSGGTCYYTTDGSTPTTSSTVYSTPISITSTTTVKAIAAISGETNSAVGVATYTIGCGLTPYFTGNIDPSQIKPSGRQGAGPLIQYASGGFTAGLPALYDCNGNVVPGSNYAADTGSANAYAVTLSPAPTIVAGSYLAFKAANANTGASTIAVNGGSATAIKKQGTTALASGDIPAGGIETLINDGANWQLLNPPGSSSGGGPALQTNGTPNGSQTLLNIAATSPVSATDNGSGTVTIACSGCSGGGGGGLVLVEAHTASSSAALNFTSCLSSTYDDYQIEMVSLVPATNSAYVWLQASTNGGTSYDTTSGHYSSEYWFVVAAGTGAGSGSTTTAYEPFRTASSTASDGGVSGTIRIFNPLGGTAPTLFNGSMTGYATSNSAQSMQQISGQYNQTTAVNAFRIILSTGNIASGTVRCYGIAH